MTTTIARSIESDPPRSATIAGVCARYGYSKTYVYERLAAGEFTARKAGRRVLVDLDFVDHHHASLPPARIAVPSLMKRRAARMSTDPAT